MSNETGAPKPLSQNQSNQPQALDITDKVPVISDWMQEWGWIPIGIGAIVVAAEADHLGHLYGPFDAWALIAVALGALIAAWWVGHTHRREIQRARLDQAMYEQWQMSIIDTMTGREFEHACARLLATQGYANMEVIGSTPGEQGADITAVSPAGYEVAVQCKRQKANIEQEIVRELIGAVNSGRHRGRAPALMTNAVLTRGARVLAESSGVGVIARPAVQQYVAEARARIEERGCVDAATARSSQLRKSSGQQHDLPGPCPVSPFS
jgi:hypothetical protein